MHDTSWILSLFGAFVAGWLVLLGLRIRRPVTLKADGQGGMVSGGRLRPAPTPFDDSEPQGALLADHLELPVVLHYARPSGAVDVVEVRIGRIFGHHDSQGLRIGSLQTLPDQPKGFRRNLQFYRLRGLEDPATGVVMVSDADKAHWLAHKAGLLRPVREAAMARPG
ncbi:hypothetical protein MVG78_17590 [Roseomonas gilardii subsp. gilardii]|uniref:hypothetical protein n=1 Tax=Roseomonas gilardii TaxID=257708 RepID=UPI001FF7933E|nr:hypothetical protein [Roseomonas gilardii]UPG72299.1 hypothetical protein MVG78_17590 [Roseomonas gilardii subsp. gilardii]